MKTELEKYILWNQIIVSYQEIKTLQTPIRKHELVEEILLYFLKLFSRNLKRKLLNYVIALTNTVCY